MPYEKGHEYHPPKDGKAPGRSPAERRAMRSLAVAVTDNMPADRMVEFWMLVLEGEVPRLTRDEDGRPTGFVKEEHGYSPSLQDRMRALEWLANRGHGQPAQHAHIVNELRAVGVQATVALEGMTPAQLRALRGIMRGEIGPAPGADTPASETGATQKEPDAIDAAFNEVNVKEPDASAQPVAG